MQRFGAFVRWLGLIAAVAALFLTPVGGAAQTEPASEVPVIDLRVGLSQSVPRDGSLAEGVGQAGYVALDRGRVIGALLPLPVSEASGQDDAASDYATLRTALSFSERFEVDGCHPVPGRIAAWFELEAPDELANDPSLVGLWVARGARVFAIAGSHDSGLGSAASGLGAGPIAGLTTAGRNVVRRILAAGALVDVSNASDPTIDDVIDLAKAAHAPVIASHSNARALADEPRNLSDTQIREIANSGGLIGVTAVHGSLAPGRTASLTHLVRQITYMVQLVGAEHVALGIGFEAGVGPVTDFRSAADFPRLATALRAAGLKQRDVARVFYQNAQRLLCPAAAGQRAK
jgi:membrane dipeptidase